MNAGGSGHQPSAATTPERPVAASVESRRNLENLPARHGPKVGDDVGVER